MSYLPPTRELRVRLDTAQALTQLFYGEHGIVLTCGGWVPSVPRLESKTELAQTAWESALAADALRERVFELRYPSRFLGAQGEAPTVSDPDGLRALVAQLRDGYRSYLTVADGLADGPSIRIVEAALRDKERQAEALSGLEAPPREPLAAHHHVAALVVEPAGGVAGELPAQLRRELLEDEARGLDRPHLVQVADRRADLERNALAVRVGRIEHVGPVEAREEKPLVVRRVI